MPSSVVRDFDYASGRNELTITFVSGRVYVYSLVPPAVAQAMGASFSKGAFFNREIRNRYPVREVTAADKAATTPALARSVSQSGGSRDRGR
jgi:hypothetical protein